MQGRLAILSPSIKPLFVLAPEFDWDIGCEGVAFKSGALELFLPILCLRADLKSFVRDNRKRSCRISDSDALIPVVDLGTQHLTGVFPKTVDQEVTSGPLGLVWCRDSGLLQLSHSYDLGEMYGENYGYRSGLNQSMVEHLQNKVQAST